jgi:uncharacterized protein (DUF1697 family)
MTTYISLLRGINVSGKNSIKMEALKQLYIDLHFTQVQTYLQSGNVVFRHPQTDTNTLAAAISSQIKSTFGFDVPVMVLAVDDLKRIIDNNPLVADASGKDTIHRDAAFLHVTFLSTSPNHSAFDAILKSKAPNEEAVLTDNAVYLYCPNGYGKTKLSNNFIETKLKVVATTRNWKTTTELLKMASNHIS